MTDQTREAFEAFLATPAPDEYDTSNADARHIWQAATKSERERCALVSEKFTNHRRIVLGAINGKKPTECEIAAAIRQGGEA